MTTMMIGSEELTRIQHSLTHSLMQEAYLGFSPEEREVEESLPRVVALLRENRHTHARARARTHSHALTLHTQAGAHALTLVLGQDCVCTSLSRMSA